MEKKFKEIDNLIEKMRYFFEEGYSKEINFRIDALKKLKNAIKKNEAKITDALYNDLKKSKFETFITEIIPVYEEIKLHLKNIKKWSKIKKVKTNIFLFPSKSYISPSPYGIVLIISPWNYPFQLSILPLVGAISSGNCCVLKPSEFSVNTTKVIKEIIEETFDPSFISVITGTSDIANYLLEKEFDYIFFTGSNTVGKIVMEKAAKNLIPVTLELGGKSPCIIEKDTNIQLAAKRIAWGKFLNAGQTCVAPDYVLVNQQVKEIFIKRIIQEINKFYGNDPKNSPYYSRIINQKHFQRILSLISKNKVIFGGNYDEKECYIEPTILDNVELEDKVMQEEIFGPLLPVIGFSHLEEAIEIVKRLPSPLALYIFCEDSKKINYILSKCPSGGVCINDTILHVSNLHLPFGGIGKSGIGTYHGKKSFDAFTHYRAIFKSSIKIDVPLKYPPFTLRKLKFLKFFY